MGTIMRFRTGNPMKITIDVVSEAQVKELEALGRTHDAPTSRDYMAGKITVDMWCGDHLMALKENCRKHGARSTLRDPTTGKERDCEWLDKPAQPGVFGDEPFEMGRDISNERSGMR